VEAYFAQARLARAALEDGASTVTPVKLQLFVQLYDESYAQQKACVIKFYLDVIRAITAVKLEPTSIPRSILRLGSWDNLSGQLFNNVILPQLRAEIDTLQAKNNRFATTATEYRGWITKETHPYIFGYKRGAGNTLTQTRPLRPFNLVIDTANCYDILGINLQTVFDVRMKQCWVILEGARRKKEDNSDLVIDVNVAFTRGFMVTNGKTEQVVDDVTGSKQTRDVAYLFSIDKVQTGSRFEHDKGDPTKTKLRTTEEQPKTRMLQLDETNPELRRPVQSPLAEWSIWWDESTIDVSKVSRSTIARFISDILGIFEESYG
jgi:hypothetical protein